MYTIIDAGKVVAESLGPLDHKNGMNENCLQSKEWTTQRGVSYRVEIFDYHKGFPSEYMPCLCWTAYRLEACQWGTVYWKKIPCWTGAEERAFPRHVAMTGQRMVDEYGKEIPQLELAL